MRPSDTQFQHTFDLSHSLQALAAFARLPTGSSDSFRHELTETAADLLADALALDFACVRLNGTTPEDPITAVRSRQAENMDAMNAIGRALSSMPYGESGAAHVLRLPEPFAAWRVSITPIGLQNPIGWLAATSSRVNFPTSEDELFCSLVAAQAALLIQHAHNETDLCRAKQINTFFSESSAGYTCVACFDGRDITLESASEGFTMITGYRAEEFNSQIAVSAVHPDDATTVMQTVERVLQGETVTGEARVIRKDGGVRWLRYLAQPSWAPGDISEDGLNFLSQPGSQRRHVRIFGAAQDITRYKEFGDRENEAEGRLRQLAETIKEVFWMSDPGRSQILYCSPAYAEIWGRPIDGPSEQACSWLDSIVPEDREAFAGALERQAAGNSTDLEYRIRRPDGSVRWIRERSFPVKDLAGQLRRIAGAADDVTERRRSEERAHFLAAASASLSKLTDEPTTLQRIASLAAPQFADWCAVDMLGPEDELHRLAAAHTDPARTELIRQEFLRYPPRLSDPTGILKALQSGASVWSAEISDDLLLASAQDEEHLQILRSLGSRSCIRIPLRPRGRAAGVISFYMGDSGRTFGEDDVQAAKDLGARIEIGIENANLLAALQDADHRKDEFLAMLAHELRNPLAPILNALEILRNRDDVKRDDAAPELSMARDIADRQARQMVRLVDDLLDISRITEGKIELRKEQITLSEIVSNALEASRPVIDRAGHELTVSIPHEAIYLYADPTRLSQALLNLLNNAAKYTPAGGHIWLSAEIADNDILVTVKDTGIGIPAEILPHIFEPFMQADHSLERSAGGLGIGLALARRLVEMHGGSIHVCSVGPGKGSEFVMQLPITPGATKPIDTRTPTQSQKSSAAPRRILIADDNQDAADTLALILKSFGYDVHTVYDGLAAVEEAVDFHPDVALLDIGMPGLNGLEAASRIRQKHGERVTLVALTGWGQAQDRGLSKDAGFDHHLVKPVDLDELNRLLAG